MDEILRKQIDGIIENHGRERKFLLPVLLEAQRYNKGNYVSEEMASYIGSHMNVSLSEVFEVISFYFAIREKPVGDNLVMVCDSAVCRLNHSKELKDELENLLGIRVGETTEDNRYTLIESPCFGACDISPAIRVNEKVFGNLTKEKLKEIFDRLEAQ